MPAFSEEQMLAPTFRRLSSPGASALSIWELRCGEDELKEFLHRDLPAKFNFPYVVSLQNSAGTIFDQGVFWLRVREGEDDVDGLHSAGPLLAELHLHGGHGPAAALRQRLNELGWQSPIESKLQDSAWQQFLRARGSLNACAANARLHGPPAEFLKLCESGNEGSKSISSWAENLVPFLKWAKVLQSPPQIVLAGPPNSGKSTLFNAWLQVERVTVSPHPGTTRDAIEAGVLLGTPGGSWEATLIDTAGIWRTGEALDLAAIAETERILQNAWKVIWLLDGACNPKEQTSLLMRWKRNDDLVLVNKSDLGARWESDFQEELGSDCQFVSVEKEGLALINRLEALISKGLGPVPDSGQWLPLSEVERTLLLQTIQGRTP